MSSMAFRTSEESDLAYDECIRLVSMKQLDVTKRRHCSLTDLQVSPDVRL
jgi:hypothetical protein